MEWYNEPPSWRDEGGILTVTTAPDTDFWCVTHYGFVRDTGHVRYAMIAGDVTAEVHVQGAYRDLYDQAGLMIRLDERNWIKCGIELVDGVQQVSAVVTREYSDWSVAPLPDPPPALWLRVSRRGSALEVQYALDGERYALLRLAYLPPAEVVRVGPMCASPEGDGVTVAFEGFTVRGL
jgi:regulation of enolase protein 1 (concanavalin A-like superfamily)